MNTTKNTICSPELIKQAFLIELVINAKWYAIGCHEDTNHRYDGRPYSTHLQMVFEYAVKYQHLLPEELRPYALAAAWTHDVIEDCRQTYNDVKKVVGEQVAEITYALTNDKGQTRKERAGEKYYRGIRGTPGARFVKICDRLANTKYSKDNGSRMLEAYRKEYKDFENNLYSDETADMFFELNELTNK